MTLTFMENQPSSAKLPGIHVICIGVGGGPAEDNVSSVLVRATHTNWAKQSLLAVDAGCHLASIANLLETYFPRYAPTANQSSSNSPTNSCATTLTQGPFAGLTFPAASARANALYLMKEQVGTYLITHPHLDHFSAFAINTAAFDQGRKLKYLAGLPFTIDALKSHVFNDIIWPNLTDENNGVGFISLKRLAESGNNSLGHGDSKGYIELTDGLAVKALKISHGTCASESASSGSIVGNDVRRSSFPGFRDPNWDRAFSVTTNYGLVQPLRPSPFPLMPISQQQRLFTLNSSGSDIATNQASDARIFNTQCITESTAYFIRTEGLLHYGQEECFSTNAREILVFGDVEPDSISKAPRTHLVWEEAAPRIARGFLTGIFIECSFPDSRPDHLLFGHLVPRHLIAELTALAKLVSNEVLQLQKRVRITPLPTAVTTNATATAENAPTTPTKAVPPNGTSVFDPNFDLVPALNSEHPESPFVSPSTTPAIENRAARSACAVVKTNGQQATTVAAQSFPTPTTIPAAATTALSHKAHVWTGLPLKDITVVIIHVKDDMRDSPWAGEVILQELLEYEAQLAKDGQALGCKFIVAKPGDSLYF